MDSQNDGCFRPAPDIPSWSENETWEVVYPRGVSGRRSTLYGDKAFGADGKPSISFKQGFRFTGRALKGYRATVPPDHREYDPSAPEMIMVTGRKTPKGTQEILYLPMKTESGKEVPRLTTS